MNAAFREGNSNWDCFSTHENTSLPIMGDSTDQPNAVRGYFVGQKQKIIRQKLYLTCFIHRTWRPWTNIN